jgi:hypothetical protein
MKLINKKSYFTEATGGNLTDTPLYIPIQLLRFFQRGLQEKGDKLKKADIPLLFIVSIASTCTVNFPN